MLSRSAACGFMLRAEEATSTEDGIHEVGTYEETKPPFRTEENHFQIFQNTWVHQNVALGPGSPCWHLPQIRKRVSINSGTKMGQGPLGHQLSCGQTSPILRCLPYADSHPKVISSPCLTFSLVQDRTQLAACRWSAVTLET